MYIAHTAPGRYTLTPLGLVLYLEEEEEEEEEEKSKCIASICFPSDCVINTKISIKDYSIIMLYYNINNNIKI